MLTIACFIGKARLRRLHAREVAARNAMYLDACAAVSRTERGAL